MAGKIKDIGKTLEKADIEKIMRELGARRRDISELTKEDCESGEYIPLGSPVIIPPSVIPNIGESGRINYYAGKILLQKGISLDEAVGYRFLEQDEEQELREECVRQGHQHPLIVRYYGKKQKTA